MARDLLVLSGGLLVLQLLGSVNGQAAGLGPGAGEWKHDAPEAHGLSTAVSSARQFDLACYFR